MTTATQIVSRPRIPRNHVPAILATALGFTLVALYGMAYLGAFAKAVLQGRVVHDTGHPFMHDFLTHYATGRMILAGQFGSLYELDVQHAAQNAVIPGYQYESVYLLPPIAAPIFAPFALLPYALAAPLWAICGVLLVAASVRALWTLSPMQGSTPGLAVAALLAGSYPFAMNLGTGNNAAIWLAIYAFGFRALSCGNDVLAGVILGFGALKPQLFLAVPVLLLAQRKGKALAASAGTAAVLAATSVLLVGERGVRDYLGFLTSNRYEADVAIANTWRMPSFPAFVRSLTPELGQVQTLAIIAAGLLLLAWAIRGATLPTATAAAVVVGLLVDPHVFPYDALVLAVPFLIWTPREPAILPRLAIATLFPLTWLMLFVEYPEPGTFAAAPWATIPLAFVAWAALRDARREAGKDATAPLPTVVAARIPA